MTQRETRISTERLAELIERLHDAQHCRVPTLTHYDERDTESALRELAAMRLDGWVLVPREPTQEMAQAAVEVGMKNKPGFGVASAFCVYRAMLAAAGDA